MQLSIRARLGLLTGSAVVAIGALTAQSWLNLNLSIQALQTANGNVALVRSSTQADSLHDGIHSNVSDARLAALTGDAAGLDRAERAVQDETRQFLDELGRVAAAPLSAGALTQLRETQAEAQRYRESAVAALAALRRDGRAEAELARFDASFHKLESLMDDATGAIAKQIDTQIDDAEAMKSTVRTATLLGSSLVMAVLLVLGVFTARSILRPIDRLVAATRSLNSGDSDLSRRLPPAAAEFGVLSAEFNGFIARLAALVGDIQRATSDIRSESSQIASGNADLQQRTEASASNLQQTAASVEEINATIKQTAESARQARDLVNEANEAASRGGDAVGRAVHSMDEISEASRRIADIVNVIDGIAFQTNILALNASVEAARAGSQGRGFAVVAAEVRTLAQRSGEAAREIATLIRSSVDKVSSGTARVRDAGQAMDDIVGRVQHVAERIGEITVASGEQSAGMEQVNVAVAELDRMTQQNAALVEQSAAAAQVMSDRAGALSTAVGGYRI